MDRSLKVAAVDRGRCVACGACVKICPKAALSVYKGCWAAVDGNVCLGCGKCARLCPADCISIEKRGEQNEI